MAQHTLRLQAERLKTRRNITTASALDRVSAAYAMAAALTIVFNTILTWAKEAYQPLHAFMASLTGHHWTTHGIADVVLFVVLGLAFVNWGVAARMAPQRLIGTLIGAVVVAGLGLVGFFVLL